MLSLSISYLDWHFCPLEAILNLLDVTLKLELTHNGDTKLRVTRVRQVSKIKRRALFIGRERTLTSLFGPSFLFLRNPDSVR